MAPVTTELKVAVKVAGDAGLDKLSRSLINIGKQSKVSSVDLRKISAELKQVQQGSNNSISSLRNYRNAWRDIAEQVKIGSKEFKEATREANRLDKQLQKAERRRSGGGGRLRAGAQIAGSVAAAGVFGGPEGAIGAGIGAVFGGPAGAAVGGAIGAQASQLRQAAGAAAEYSANLRKLRIALFGVTSSSEEYQDSLAFITQTTKDFAIPQEVVTRQFTRLQASVQGAGGNIEDTKVAFNGIVAAVRATGGSLADVDAALTATAQVFSKGKVSAEELRQQIGERLPGAFTLFAESVGLTPQELDKALEDGKVSLQDFQTFAEALFERYGENAQQIADGPESAGDRLQVALSELNQNVGELLAPIGAAFQETFISIIEIVNLATIELKKFFGVGVEGLDNRVKTIVGQIRQLEGQRKKLRPPAEGSKVQTTAFTVLDQQIERLKDDLRKAQDELNIAIEEREGFAGVTQRTSGTGLPGIVPSPPKGAARARKEVVDYTEQEFYLRQRINDAFEKEQLYVQAIAEFDLKIFQINRDLVQQPLKQLDEFRKAEIKLSQEILKIDEQRVSEAEKLEKGIEEFNKMLADMVPETENLKELWKSVGDTITSSVAGAIEAAIFEAKSLQESLSGILRSVASIFIQFGTKSLLGGLFPSANGNVFAQNKIVPFAYGGVVKKPTLFPMANGTGLMGEAGPEAIMPLRRTSSGRLGVEVTGGTNNIVVNVDASGTQVQGDDTRGKQLGGAISAAVQAELIKQRRPGGLLAS
jgi:tape measure domain-containing protein